MSQRNAKKGFKAAMEQQSLENTPPPAAVQPPAVKPQPTAPHANADPQQPQQGGTPSQTAAPGSQPAPEAPLSFYKTLPSGQKSNMLGSGINSADDKTAKQPLQAAIPSNLTKTAQPQSSANTSKPSAPTAPEKQPGRQDPTSYTVQIASYSLRSEADSLKNKLAGKGYNVHINESNQGDKGTWYRVRVGKKLDQEAAKELASKLGKGAIPIPEKD